MQDLISWSAIGACTTEPQTHRIMSSGLSRAVGFKNGTDGGFDIVINALKSVSRPHNFLGSDAGGHVSMVETTGNKYGHIVLRGGNGQPNYDAENIARCEAELRAAGDRSIIGLMIESNINAGRQPIPDDVSRLKYGVSVTDGCIDWETTEGLITGMHAQLASM